MRHGVSQFMESAALEVLPFGDGGPRVKMRPRRGNAQIGSREAARLRGGIICRGNCRKSAAKDVVCGRFFLAHGLLNHSREIKAAGAHIQEFLPGWTCPWCRFVRARSVAIVHCKRRPKSTTTTG